MTDPKALKTPGLLRTWVRYDSLPGQSPNGILLQKPLRSPQSKWGRIHPLPPPLLELALEMRFSRVHCEVRRLPPPRWYKSLVRLLP